jgi:hypothetical protein
MRCPGSAGPLPGRLSPQAQFRLVKRCAAAVAQARKEKLHRTRRKAAGLTGCAVRHNGNVCHQPWAAEFIRSGSQRQSLNMVREESPIRLYPVVRHTSLSDMSDECIDVVRNHGANASCSNLRTLGCTATTCGCSARSQGFGSASRSSSIRSNDQQKEFLSRTTTSRRYARVAFGPCRANQRVITT